MKISVVTAVYNRRHTISDAIESVQSQSHDDVEHIIQDGGSTDGTLEEAHRRATKQTMINSQPDYGIYDALNKGIESASGDVIGFMHSDDYFASPDVLAKVAKMLEDPDLDGIYGDLDYVAKNDPTRVVRHWVSGECTQDNLELGWMPPHPTLYLRRKVYERFGPYDTSYQIAADYEAMLRYMTKGKIRLGYIPHVMVKMRTGGESNKSLGRLIQKSREDLRAMRTHCIGGKRTLIRKNLSKIKQFASTNRLGRIVLPITKSYSARKDTAKN